MCKKMKNTMKRKRFTYRRIPNMTVGMQSQEDRDLQVLHGRAILNEDDRTFLFLQNTPRGPRSTEVMRTRHGRLVRTPQGTFTLTFRFSPDEADLQPTLVGEMIDVCVGNNLTNNLNS